MDFCDTVTTRGANGAEKTALGCEGFQKVSRQVQQFLSKLPDFQHGLLAGPKQAWRTYQFLQKADKTVSSFSVSEELRFSFRFNWQRIYNVWKSQNDFILSNYSIMKLNNTTVVGSFEGAYRYKSTATALCKSFQKTKLYSKL